MESVGSIIKLARESRKVTLSKAAETTRISARHLQSIEEGRYRDLPGGMYNRAFIRAYAEYLGLDPAAILSRYADETAHTEKPAPRLKIAVTQPSQSSQGHPVLAWSVMLLISVTGIFFSRHWIAEVFSPYFSHTPTAHVEPVVREQKPAEPQTTPPPQPQPAPEQPPAAEPGPVGATAAPPVTPPVAQPLTGPVTTSVAPAEGKLQIRLQASDNCWTSVTSDATRVLSAELKAGDDHSFGAEREFTIVLGNAGGVNLSINGKPAKPLGKTGAVVKLVITEQNLAEYLQNP